MLGGKWNIDSLVNHSIIKVNHLISGNIQTIPGYSAHGHKGHELELLVSQ